MLHYFEEEESDVYLYDIGQKKVFKNKLDFEIPSNSQSIAVDQYKIFIMGCPKLTGSFNWEYSSITQN